MPFDLESLGRWKLRKEDFRNAMSTVMTYELFTRSSKRNNRFFRNTALYAVGSSLKNGPYNDVDLTVVGLYLMPRQETTYESPDGRKVTLIGGVKPPEEYHDWSISGNIKEPVLDDLQRLFEDIFPDSQYVRQANLKSPWLNPEGYCKGITYNDGDKIFTSFDVRDVVIRPKADGEVPIHFMLLDEDITPRRWEDRQMANHLPYFRLSIRNNRRELPARPGKQAELGAKKDDWGCQGF